MFHQSLHTLIVYEADILFRLWFFQEESLSFELIVNSFYFFLLISIFNVHFIFFQYNLLINI